AIDRPGADCASTGRQNLTVYRMDGTARLRRTVCALHPVVDRAFAPLGRDPDDVLCGVLDVAGLAVHAVLRVDLQPVLTRFGLDELVHPGRAKAGLRAAVAREVHRYGNRGILQRQVD